MCNLMQASERLAGRFVEFAGERHELSKLCGATLVTGTTGCGKTLGVVNPLAARIASIEVDSADSQEHKAAVVYFNCKGRGDASFLEALPASRREDVVRITPESGMCLFPRWAWKSHSELAQAVAAFFPELGRLLHATEFEFGSHFVYWQNLRDEFLRFVSGLDPEKKAKEADREEGTPDAGIVAENDAATRTSALAGESHFRCVLERAHALLEDITLRRSAHNEPSDTNIARVLAARFGKERWVEALALMRKDFERAMNDPGEMESLRLRAEWISFFNTHPATASVDEMTLSIWEDFAEAHPALREQALDAAVRYAEKLDGTWEGISGEVRGLIDPFRSCGNLFGGRLSFEEVLDEGKIAVIDLPAAGAAGAHRAALLALLFAFMNTLLGRYRRLNRNGELINQTRPVVLVLDEFHSLLTRGRDDGFELFLSRCREFGCMTLLATQNLRLVASALGNANKFESLLGLFGTCFFGRNTDSLTNEYASLCCGKQVGAERAAAVDFGLGNRALGPWLKSDLSQDAPARFAPDAFARLRTGEFVMRAADGGVRMFDCFARAS